MLSSLCLQTLIAWPSGICCSRQAAWLVSVLFPIYSTWQIAKCTTGLGQFRQHWAVCHLTAGQKLGNTQESLRSHSCGTCWPVFRKLCLHKCHSVYDCHGGSSCYRTTHRVVHAWTLPTEEVLMQQRILPLVTLRVLQWWCTLARVFELRIASCITVTSSLWRLAGKCYQLHMKTGF